MRRTFLLIFMIAALTIGLLPTMATSSSQTADARSGEVLNVFHFVIMVP